MVRETLARRAAAAMLYFGLCALVLSVHLIPQSMEPGGMVGPDLLFCVTCAWMLRRPDHLPVLLVAAVFLLADLLTQRPPGLWAALMVAAGEGLRARALSGRPLAFLAEWGWIAALIMAMTLAKWAVLGMAMVAQLDLGQWLAVAAVTALGYPLVVGALRACGLRRLSYGEVPGLRDRG